MFAKRSAVASRLSEWWQTGSRNAFACTIYFTPSRLPDARYNQLMDVSERFKLLVALIGLVALGGLLVIIILLVLWRRFNERQTYLDKKDRTKTDYNDAWSEAGQRLQEDEDPDDSDDEEDDDEDQDAGEGWRSDDSDDDDDEKDNKRR